MRAESSISTLCNGEDLRQINGPSAMFSGSVLADRTSAPYKDRAPRLVGGVLLRRLLTMQVANAGRMKMVMTRRAVLAGSLVVSAACVSMRLAQASPSAPISVDQFRTLSAKLTGFDAAELDADLAEKYLSALLEVGRGSELARLIEGQAPSADVAKDIMTAWYSGVHRTVQGEALVTFNDALIWSSLDFTKPFASCGGETGYWAAPPET